jgi:hypothetical protein
MALVDQLESQLATSQVKARGLLDAVVHELLHPSAAIGFHVSQCMLRNPPLGNFTQLASQCMQPLTPVATPCFGESS